MGSCASLPTDSPPTEATADMNEVKAKATEPNTAVKESSTQHSLNSYVSWSKRKGSELIKAVYNTPKRTFSVKHKKKENAAAIEDKPLGLESVLEVKESLAPAPTEVDSKTTENPTVTASDTANERKLEETVSVFGTGASMKVPSSFGSKDAGSVAGATVLERHNVVVVGEGPELLFLSHGFGTNQQIWGGILEHLDLQNTYKVIMWDLMGAYRLTPFFQCISLITMFEL